MADEGSHAQHFFPLPPDDEFTPRQEPPTGRPRPWYETWRNGIRAAESAFIAAFWLGGFTVDDPVKAAILMALGAAFGTVAIIADPVHSRTLKGASLAGLIMIFGLGGLVVYLREPTMAHPSDGKIVANPKEAPSVAPTSGQIPNQADRRHAPPPISTAPRIAKAPASTDIVREVHTIERSASAAPEANSAMAPSSAPAALVATLAHPSPYEICVNHKAQLLRGLYLLEHSAKLSIDEWDKDHNDADAAAHLEGFMMTATQFFTPRADDFPGALDRINKAHGSEVNGLFHRNGIRAVNDLVAKHDEIELLANRVSTDECPPPQVGDVIWTWTPLDE